MSKVERAHSYQKTQSQEQAGIAVVVNVKFVIDND